MAAERICILHIGQPKTGSTSIQRALAGYDDGTTFAATFEKPNHSRPIGIAFRKDAVKLQRYKDRGLSEAEIRRYRELYRAEFSAMLARRDRDRIIVSAEVIWELSDADKAGLVEFIRQQGWEVQVIAYVREPIGFTPSWVSEFIGGRRCSAQIIPNEFSPHYRRGLSAFAELLPPEHLHVRIYDRDQLAGGDVVEDFCQALDLDLPRNIPRENESLSLPAMKLLFRFNRTGILSMKDPILVTARMRLIRMLAETFMGGERLNSSLCMGIADWSETDWLYETFGIDFRPKTPLPETSPETSAADLEAFLTDISDVDLSGLDALLAGYGIRHANFTTAEEKLHRLFYAALTEQATRERDQMQAEHDGDQSRCDQQSSRVSVLFRNLGKNLAKTCAIGR